MKMQFLPDVDFHARKIDWKIFLNEYTEESISIFCRFLMRKALLSITTTDETEKLEFIQNVYDTGEAKFLNLPDENKPIDSYGEFPILFPDEIFDVKFNLRLHIMFKEGKPDYLLLTTSGETELDLPKVLLATQDMIFQFLNSRFS